MTRRIARLYMRAESEGEVVLSVADVLVALRAGVRIFFQGPGVLREVVCEEFDDRNVTREHDLSMPDRRPGGVERFRIGLLEPCVPDGPSGRRHVGEY
jgi:hypothetical protein